MEKRGRDTNNNNEDHENNLKKLRVYSTVILESIIQSDLLSKTPRDVLFKILLLLPFSDLNNMNKVSKDINQLLSDHSFWVNVILGDFGLSHPLNQNAVHDDVLLLREIINGQKSVESVFNEDVVNAYDDREYLIAKSRLLFVIDSFKKKSLIDLYYDYILKSLNNECFVLTAFNPKPNDDVKEILKKTTKAFSLFICDDMQGVCSTESWDSLESIELRVERHKDLDRIYINTHLTDVLKNFSMGLSECRLYPSKNNELKIKHIPKSKMSLHTLTHDNKFDKTKQDFTEGSFFYMTNKSTKYRVIIFTISYESPSEKQRTSITLNKNDLTIIHDTGVLELNRGSFIKTVKNFVIGESGIPIKKVTIYNHDYQRDDVYITMKHNSENNLFKFMVPEQLPNFWGLSLAIVFIKSITLKIPKEKVNLQLDFFNPNRRMYLYEKEYRDEQIKLSKSLNQHGILVKSSEDTTDNTKIQDLMNIGLSIESKHDLIFIKEGDGSSTLLDKSTSKLYCNHKLNHDVHKNYLQNSKKKDYNACPVCGIEEELKKHGM